MHLLEVLVILAVLLPSIFLHRGALGSPLLARRYRRDFFPPTNLANPVPPARPPQPDPLRPEHVDPNNPYLESLAEPINPSYGLGVGYQKPTILGGSANFPTGNIFRPTENLNGTFGFTQVRNVRFGTQGGPFFPWQDPKYAGAAKALADMQQQQQQQQEQQAAEAAAAQQQAQPPPTPPPLPGQSLDRDRDRIRQLSAAGLATPPPLPTRF